MRPGHPLVRRPALAAQSDGLITHYHDDLTCTDRVAIVTGGSRSVGREVVRKLANRGHAVVVGYIRDQGAADSIVEEVLAAGGTTLTTPRRSRRRARRRTDVRGDDRGLRGHRHPGPRGRPGHPRSGGRP